MTLYISDISLLLLLFLYLPLVAWVLSRIWRNQRWGKGRKAGLVSLCIVLAYAIPLGDVTVNSMAMAKVCPSAGLKIYTTVDVEGFVGKYSLRNGPYRFIEYPVLKADGKYYWKRQEKTHDGIAETVLARPTADFEVLVADDYAKHNGIEAPGYDSEINVYRSRWVIRNRRSGEVLAEWKFFRAIPGWLDQFLVLRWFGSGGAWLSCSSRDDFSGWIEKVLRPQPGPQ